MINIPSKFDVNDLVKHKYTHENAETVQMLFEVIEINAQKCYGGVQVFLQCRSLHASYDNPFGKPKELIAFHPGGSPKEGNQYFRFREDELVLCSEEIQALVKEGKRRTIGE
jgi:hypothetical protein